MKSRIRALLPWMAALLVASAMAGGCAGGSSVTLEEYSEPKAEIAAAEEAGAEQVPEAQKYLEMARQKMARARQTIQEGDEDTGNRLLMMAEADAQLAGAYARAENLRKEVREGDEEIEELQRDIQPE